MARSIAILTLLLAAATPAGAQDLPSITLSPGEAITVRIGEDGRAGEPERGRAIWSRFDLFAAQHLAGLTPPGAPVPVGTPLSPADGTRPDPIPPGEVRIRFFSIADSHTLLVLENGQALALAYRARMTVRGRSHPTDVCVILPRYPSYEHWAYPIERIELSHFRFIPWPPNRAPTCE